MHEVWVCQGRICTSYGADAVYAAAVEASQDPEAGCRVLRGGCYGLCDSAPNVVVRQVAEHAASHALADTLTLREDESETVYSWVAPAEVTRIVRSRSAGDVDTGAAWTRSAREASHARRGNVADRIARLRQLRARTGRE
jgi:(2Fe-2S) ferredoxin